MTRDIVHVLGSLGRGGIETWLTHVLRTSAAIRERTSLVLIGDEVPDQESYAGEVAAMGIPVYRVRYNGLGIPFVCALTRTLRALHARVVHAQMNYLSGWAMWAARRAGAEVRIAHYHVSYPLQHRTPVRSLYIRGVRALESSYATQVLGCSAAAHATYVGDAWRSDPRRRVLYYGIDFLPFDERVDSRVVRAELGIPDDALVIGNVARLAPQKNHNLLLEIAARLVRSEPRLRVLLVGTGPSREAIARRAEELGIAERIVWAGVRRDVPRLLLGAVDVFVFPSTFEGLGIALVEAQAAGLPCVVSDVVPDEACVIAPLMRRISLEADLDRWAEAVRAFLHEPRAMSQAVALATVRQSPFDLRSGIRELEEMYRLPPSSASDGDTHVTADRGNAASCR